MEKRDSFVLAISRLNDPHPDEVLSRWKAYEEYIRSIQGRLADDAYEYATSEWHKDYSHRMSPHDGWIERVTIEEPSGGDRCEQRSIRLAIELLGSYHDGRIRFTYPEVKSYRIEAPSEFEWPPYGVGHGDWLADEVGLSTSGLVLHQILFSRGAVWSIEARDLRYEWLPLAVAAG